MDVYRSISVYVYFEPLLCDSYSPGEHRKTERQVACPHEADIGPWGLPTQQRDLKMWNLQVLSTLVIVTVALPREDKLSPQAWWVQASARDRKSSLAQLSFCHNGWASLAIHSFIDYAVEDGVILSSEESPRRLCWHLRFILISFLQIL